MNADLRPGEKGDWIAALEAVHLLTPTLGSDRKSKKALTERLKDGGIRATAWWIATGYDIGVPYIAVPLVLETDEGVPPLSQAELHDLQVESSKPKVSAIRAGTNCAQKVGAGNIFIGPAFWNMATTEDRKQWDWSTGLFKCSYPNPESIMRSGGVAPNTLLSRMRMYVLGAHFHRPDVEKIIGASESQPVREPRRTSNAGRKMSEHWPTWVAEVIWLHHEEGIGGMNASKLIRKIADRAAIEGQTIPSDSAVWATAVEILDLLSKRMATENS